LEGKLFYKKPLITLVVTQGKALLSTNYCPDLELHPRCSQVRGKTRGDMRKGGVRGRKAKGQIDV
jgi:hypothetical protein